MPVPTRCTHCGKAYQVSEATIGKQVKCQACGKAFVVAKVAASTGSSQPNAKAQAANGRGGTATATPPTTSSDQSEKTRIAKLEAQFGLQALPPNPNRVFPAVEYRRPKGAPDPLANHIVENPGFEQVSEAEYLAHQEEQVRKVEREKMERLAQLTEDELMPEGSQMHWLLLIAMIQLVTGIVCIGITLLSPVATLIIMLLVTCGAWICPTIELIIALSKHKQLIGILYLMIPFYNLYYYFLNIKILKDHLIGTIAILLSIFLSWVILFFGVGLVGMTLRAADLTG